MKKRIFAFITCALLLCTAALSAAYAFAADDVVTTTSASTADRPHPWELAPKTDNAGYLLDDISVYDFTKYGFGRGYGSNLTRSQGYGEYTVDGNDMFFTTNCGGDLGSFVHVYAANGANLTDATWVRFYVDCTDLVCGGKTGVGINLYLANGAKMADSNAGALLPFFVKDGATAFIRQSGASEWTSQKISNSFVYGDEGFTGYVAFPISAFKHGAEEGKKEMTNVSTFASAVKNGYKYLCRVTLRFDIADGKESGTLMFIDDLTFSGQGEKHQHTFASKGTYGADCLNGGIELFECSACGERYTKHTTDAKGHSYGEFRSDKDGVAYRICKDCGHVECDESVKDAPKGDDGLVTVTFDYGRAGGKAIVKYLKGSVIKRDDIPVKTNFFDKYTFQFNCWTSDEGNVDASDPVGVKVEEDMTFYARWIISDYTDKYKSAINVMANNGGSYNVATGRVLAFGNSNFGLYHNMAGHFKSEGIALTNHSISGSTSYDMLEYYRCCILNYKPQIIIINVTTNDMAYYSMSERIILENMKELYRLTRELAPDAHLFIVSGNPLPGRTEYYPMIERVNEAMKKYCDENEMVEYVDVYPTVLAYAKRYPTNWDTWTHMDQTALREMFSIIVRAVKPYYSADKVKS